jgi:hypothetical protein
MNKYNDGDLITFKIDDSDAFLLNMNHSYIRMDSRQIVKHEPAPINWKKAKNGDKFFYMSTTHTYSFVAIDPRCEQRGIFITDYDTLASKLLKDMRPCGDLP